MLIIYVHSQGWSSQEQIITDDKGVAESTQEGNTKGEISVAFNHLNKAKEMKDLLKHISISGRKHALTEKIRSPSPLSSNESENETTNVIQK